jgi:1,4-alpha-glucan branching enzyme
MNDYEIYKPIYYKIEERDLFVLIMRELIARMPDAVTTELRVKAGEYIALLKEHKVIIDELVFKGGEAIDAQPTLTLTKAEWTELAKLAQQIRDAKQGVKK